jgi:hypothetical protein
VANHPLAYIIDQLAQGKKVEIGLPSSPDQTVEIPAKPTANPSDAESEHVAEIAARLKRSGRDDTQAGRIAAGVRKVHTKYHAEPQHGCRYCPPVTSGLIDPDYHADWLAKHPLDEDW